MTAQRKTARHTLVALCAAALIAPSGAALAQNEPSAHPDPPSGTLVAGLIVGGSPSMGASSLTRAVSGLSAAALSGVRITSAKRTTDATVLDFDRLISSEEATAIADQLAATPQVDWVDLDLMLKPATNPALPNDPEFEDQWHLWDPTAGIDSSTDAPLGWSVTTGRASTIVAVIDTGWTAHPDLDNRQINGYDFVSDPRMSNDGDGRDSDARDPGDWVTQAESQSTFPDCYPEDSSWHGTHVAGIIAAERNNRRGVVGIAPDVRVLGVRALGKCGGRISDIADAVRWSAGGDVRGVPSNPNRAQVINMSLGGSGSCSATMRNAIDFATSRGTAVVVAAGNSNDPVSTATPANCPGVISVSASNPNGKITSWSNYGTSTMSPTITAPGESILSTYNSGRQRPGSANYGRASGTSMAAPLVAGAVALLYSLDVKPNDIVPALKRLIKPFPTRGSGTTCTTRLCGAGLLSLDKLKEFGNGPSDPPPPTEPEPSPPPNPPIGPVPLAVPGLVENPSIRFKRTGKTVRATISWPMTRGGSRPIYYQYRVQLAGKGWGKWQQRVPSRIVVSRVPRAEMSFVEIRGVNEMGRGPAYQVALFPK